MQSCFLVGCSHPDVRKSLVELGIVHSQGQCDLVLLRALIANSIFVLVTFCCQPVHLDHLGEICTNSLSLEIRGSLTAKDQWHKEGSLAVICFSNHIEDFC